ncbi:MULTISPECIES: hypothetical protein [Nocardioides]|uniref:DUF3352 domain-containing protein n=1 Tax=Nocardioides vastitatis TaxID=2568655 RepID=A0ABW0ZKF1_9ACTN|nr:hypothetical protein [Nocardioides sp.]THI96614.1 hypothetical protein E7Z54_16290 [Nocardioides sp.]
MTLGDASPNIDSPVGRSRGRRTAWVTAGSLGVAAVVGGGALAWQFWTAQGPQPAEVLPDGTLAYVAVDLDPPGGQKVAVYDAIRKFPSLGKELGLDSRDDLRRSLVDGIAAEGGCDLDRDAILSWAGDRGALAVVDGDRDLPEVVVVVQVGDADKAAAGLSAIAADCAADEFGHAIEGDWAVLARNDAVAEQVVEDAADRALADDADYRRITGAAGDPGVVTLYAAPEAGPALLRAAEENPFIGFMVTTQITPAVDPIGAVMGWITLMPTLSGAGAALGEHEMAMESDYQPSPAERRLQKRMERYDELSPAEQDQLMKEMEAFHSAEWEEELPETELDLDDLAEPSDDLRRALQDFTGLGGVLRFDDGAVELEVVGDRMLGSYGGVYAGGSGHDVVATLPADSAAAFGAGFADGWAQRSLSQIQDQWYYSGQSEEELVTSLEEATGLTFPEDFEALGGEAIAVVARSGFDPSSAAEDPSKLAAAVRIMGDPDRIEEALAKVRGAVGRSGATYLHSEATDDGIVVGPNVDYLEELASPGETLGDSDRFERAVPDADGATTVIFIDFDAGNWLVGLMDDDRDRADVEPLDTLGFTVTEDGDEQHVLVRVTLD